MNTIDTYLKFWPIVLFVGSIIGTWAIFGVKLTNVESRQDRQGETISSLRDQITEQGTAISKMEGKLDAISDNVNYIRSRIDSIAK